MSKVYQLISIFCLLTIADADALAIDTSRTDSNGFLSREFALMCIQLNKDLNLASEQMLRTEHSKAELKAKIDYLQGQVNKRRQLIEQLDQRHYQDNNDNYNQLVTQFEDLMQERKDDITRYETEHQRHSTQHQSVIRLEQRFSAECLQDVTVTEDLHREVCQNQAVRWCESFSF